jgi:hypothetical protein
MFLNADDDDAIVFALAQEAEFAYLYPRASERSVIGSAARSSAERRQRCALPPFLSGHGKPVSFDRLRGFAVTRDFDLFFTATKSRVQSVSLDAVSAHFVRAPQVGAGGGPYDCLCNARCSPETARVVRAGVSWSEPSTEPSTQHLPTKRAEPKSGVV